MSRSRSLTCLCSLLALLVLSGCAHRLRGPDHGAAQPPWVADKASKEVAALDVQHRVLLIGDAGYYLEDDPTLAALGRWAAAVESSSIVFLGDNIYNDGLTDEERERGEQILGQQLGATPAHKIVIPGNHDWGMMPKNMNAKAIRNQQAFVDEWPDGRAEFIPKDGCMGPHTRVLLEAGAGRRAVVFIALDPTPWINERLRAACPTPETHEGVLARLDRELARYSDDFVLVGSHYPMLTGGPHGGLSYGFLAELIIRPLGWMMGGLMNTYEPEYADWIARTQEVFRRNPPEVYAAGHDHSLQLLDSGDVAGIYVVSGAGARERVSTVTHLPESYFAHASEGFVVADFGTRDGRDAVVLRVVEAGSESPVFEMEIP
ncbi:MAG: hypothetical protein CL908_25110 [Deltaproteobacteria bacterium]|nr:hypothetical protein [Deltaproteobacteria bacterium]